MEKLHLLAPWSIHSIRTPIQDSPYTNIDHNQCEIFNMNNTARSGVLACPISINNKTHMYLVATRQLPGMVRSTWGGSGRLRQLNIYNDFLLKQSLRS